LIITYPVSESSHPVFNVKIVGPIEIPASSPKKAGRQNIVKKKNPGKNHSHSNPPGPDLLPQTIHEAPKGPPLSDTNKLEDSEELNTLVEPDSIPQEETSHHPPKSDDLEGEGSELSKPHVIPHSFLFDRETIEKFARRDSFQGKSLSFNMSGFKHRGYMRLLKEKIESIWQYPEKAIRRGISGDLYIRFSIKRDGRLGEVKLIRTSGYRSLDEAALRALRDAEPFWPLPEDWKKDELIINGHFIYIMGSRYIM